ncbi:MAG: hypothetical protein M3Q55_08040 [Acidobacteriota bacterium]|nr:hypothetical protein [Acidobacteriota bacterium]
MHIRIRLVTAGVLFALGLTGCSGSGKNPITPQQSATVTLVYEGSTTTRTDLPAALQGCVQGATPTHTHPSWRGFAFVQLQAISATQWQVTFSDVPVDRLVSLRVNDANACDENPTGAVTRNIFIDGVRLTTSVLTPGSGQEPGFSFRVTAAGVIQP